MRRGAVVDIFGIAANTVRDAIWRETPTEHAD